MAEDKPPSLEETEAQTKTITVAKHSKEISLVEKVLNHYLHFFRIIDKFTRNSDNDLEYAWLLLTTRSFNSLRCAFDHLQKGYYSQAMILIRSADEDWLICRDCEKNKKTLSALLEGSEKLGKNDLRYSEMAKRISDEFYCKVWSDNYGQESEIAHARQMALKILVDPNTGTLMLGSQYNNILFIATYQAILRVAVGMMEFPARLLGKDATDWCLETLPTIQAANAEIERIGKEFSNKN